MSRLRRAALLSVRTAFLREGKSESNTLLNMEALHV
jgi:hypothetical protein